MTPAFKGMLFDRSWICASCGAAMAAVLVAALGLLMARIVRGKPAPLRYGLLLAALVVLGIVPAVAAASRLVGWGAVRISNATVDRPVAPRPLLVLPAVPRPAPAPDSSPRELAVRPERVAEPAVVPMRVPTFREVASCLLWVWLAGLVFCMGRVVRDLLRLRQLRHSLAPSPSPAAVDLLREAARSVGLTQPPRLFESAAVPVPVVIGPVRPAVVLPAGMATTLDREKLAAVLLHEAAHVAHGDLWVGLLQHAVAAVFWWCPPVHRLNRRLAEAREEICDDYVVLAQGDGFQLAEVLVEMAAGLREKRQRLAIGTLGAIDEKPSLEGRVERLVDLTRKAAPMTRMNRLAMAAAGAFGLAALAIVVATTIHAADESTHPLAKTATLELHFVTTESLPGSKACTNPDTGEPLFLTMPEILTATDVASVELVDDELYPSLHAGLDVFLTDDGAMKIASATANVQGSQLALVVNGDVSIVAKVMSPLSGHFVCSSSRKRCERVFRSLTEDSLQETTTPHAGDEPPAAEPRAVSGDTAAIVLDDKEHRAWTPPDNPDPDSIRQEAEADARAGRYEIALAKHVWFHENALKINRSMSGLRLSFVLSDWKRLGQDYPPALAKLRQIRDHLAAQAKEGIDIGEGFQDLARINETLDDESKTTDAFKILAAKNPKAARRAFIYAQDSLVNDKEYALCERYIDAMNDYLQIKKTYELRTQLAENGAPKSNSPLLDHAKKSFRHRTATLVAILSINDRRLEAAEIATLAKRELEDVGFHKELEAALGETVPDPWP